MGTVMFIVGLLLYPLALYNMVRVGELFGARCYFWAALLLLFGAGLVGFAGIFSGLYAASSLSSNILAGAIGGCGVIWGRYRYDQRQKAAVTQQAQAAGEDEV